MNSVDKTKRSVAEQGKQLVSGILRRSAFTKTLRGIIGIGLAFGLIYVTLRIAGGDLWKELSQAKTSLLIVALFVHGTIIVFTGLRWNLLLRVHGLGLHVWSLIRLEMMANFLNLATPSTIGGAVLKIGVLARNTKKKKAEAILTVFLDRILGLFALFIAASIAVSLSMPYLLALEQKYYGIRVAALIVGLAGLGVAGFVTALPFHGKFRRLRSGVWITERGKRLVPQSVASVIARVLNALMLYREHPRTLLLALALSVLVHVLLAITLFCVGASVGESVLGLRHYFLALCVANAVSIIPLTPGGFGTRDAVVAMFFTALHAPAEKIAVVPVITTLVFLVWGLTGAVLFIFSKLPKAELSSAHAIGLNA
jgi:uncharacterized protein (TIRG00374 family)